MYWPRLGDRFKVLPPTLTLLLLILAVALALRLYGIGWDQGFGFHPDERSIYMRSDCMFRVLTEAPGYSECVREHPETEPGIPGPGTFFDADKSPLNPHWFPLGSLLIYLIVGIRAIFEPFMDLGSLMSMAYIGRSIAAVADVGSVFMVYLLGKRVWGSRVGLLAAALVSLAVIHIQISHFYRPEPTAGLLPADLLLVHAPGHGPSSGKGLDPAGSVRRADPRHEGQRPAAGPSTGPGLRLLAVRRCRRSVETPFPPSWRTRGPPRVAGGGGRGCGVRGHHPLRLSGHGELL